MKQRVHPKRGFVLLVLPVLTTLLVCIAANLWSARFNWYFDLTSSGVFSISENAKTLLRNLDARVHVLFFYDIRSQAMRDAKSILEHFSRYSPQFQFTAVDPMLQPSIARQYDVRFPGTAVFESRGRRIVINGGAESDFIEGLIRSTKTVVELVCFTEGHSESDPFSFESLDHSESNMSKEHFHSSGGVPLIVDERHGLSRARVALESLGYLVDKRRLTDGGHALNGCKVVVIASPEVAFLPDEIDVLEAHFLNGGGGVILLEPEVKTGLDDLFADFGIRSEWSRVIDEKQHYRMDPSTPAVTEYHRHAITRNLGLSFFPGVLSFDPIEEGVPEGVVVTPLVESSHSSRIVGSESRRQRTLAVYIVRSLKEETGQKLKSRVVVFGDGDFATNFYFSTLGNGALFVNAVDVAMQGASEVGVLPRSYQTPRIELTNQQMRWTFLTSTIFLPILLLSIGLWVWRRGR